MPSRDEKQRRRTILRNIQDEKRKATTEYLKRMRNQKWYFVLRRDDITCEVQLLDSQGRGKAWREYTDATAPLEVGGELVPIDVLQAGLRRTTFDGDYVNEKGESVAPW